MVFYLQATVEFFSKSNKAVAELRKARHDVDITTGLVKIGKTRFATHWAAASALNRCLPLIQDLVEEGKIKLVRTQTWKSGLHTLSNDIIVDMVLTLTEKEESSSTLYHAYPLPSVPIAVSPVHCFCRPTGTLPLVT
jgi:hypothetical protein